MNTLTSFIEDSHFKNIPKIGLLHRSNMPIEDWILRAELVLSDYKKMLDALDSLTVAGFPIRTIYTIVAVNSSDSQEYKVLCALSGIQEYVNVSDVATDFDSVCLFTESLARQVVDRQMATRLSSNASFPSYARVKLVELIKSLALRYEIDLTTAKKIAELRTINSGVTIPTPQAN